MAGVASGTSFAVGSSMTTATGLDELARWWAAVVAVGAHWLSGEDNLAEKLYPVLEAFPKQLANSE